VHSAGSQNGPGLHPARCGSLPCTADKKAKHASAWRPDPAGRRVQRLARARLWSPRAHGGLAAAGSSAADSVHGHRVEHRCGEGVAPGTVAGNEAHQKGGGG
jgi:hypothetical protein